MDLHRYMDNTENRRLAKNSVIVYIRLVLTIIIGLWSSRYLLQNLGFSDYGLYNVVGGVITMFCFLNGSLISAASRFVTYNINNYEKLQRIFSTIKLIHLLFALLVVFLGETVGLWFVLNKLSYPVNREIAVYYVYQASIVTAVLNIINTPYNALLIAHENMSIYAVSTLGSTILRFLITILIAYIPYDGLIFYAIAYMSILLLERVFVQLYSRYKYPESRINIKFYKEECKSILSFSFWTVNGNLAIICYTQGLNILLNMFFGSIVNAARGIAVQVQSVVMQFCSNFQMVINPQIIKSYASEDLNRMHRLVILSSKFSFFLTSIIIIPIIYNSDTILRLWLGDVPDYAKDFVNIMLIISLLSTISNPLTTSIQATGNIKKFQIYEGTSLMAILPVSYIVLKLFDAPPISVFVVNLIIIIITQGVRVWIVLPNIGMSKKIYFREVIIPICLTFIVCNILPCIEYMYLLHNICTLLIITISSLICSMLVIFFIGCSMTERNFLIAKLRVEYEKRFNRK